MRVYKLEINNNYNFVNNSAKLFNDGVHDTVFNTSMETFVVLENILSVIKLSIPADANDRSYDREVIKSSFDLGKFLHTVRSNFLAKSVYEVYSKALDSNATLPLPKVREDFHYSWS